MIEGTELLNSRIVFGFLAAKLYSPLALVWHAFKGAYGVIPDYTGSPKFQAPGLCIFRTGFEDLEKERIKRIY